MNKEEKQAMRYLALKDTTNKMNFTLDNQFRHPLRWRKCPFSVGAARVYGIKSEKYQLVGSVGSFMKVTFYFHKWFYRIENIRIK